MYHSLFIIASFFFLFSSSLYPVSRGFNRIEFGAGKNFFLPPRRKGNFCRKFFKAFWLSGFILVTIEQYMNIFYLLDRENLALSLLIQDANHGNVRSTHNLFN